MKFRSAQCWLCLTLSVAIVLGRALITRAQVSTNPAQIPDKSTPGTSQSSSEYSYSRDIEAERKKIWESDEMLEARAWLEDHFRRSAKISDAQGKKYLAELEAMSPDQMKLWLIKFRRELDRRIEEGKSFRRMNRQRLETQMASPQVGGFRNPYRGQGRASSGLPAASMRQTIGGQANPIASRPTVQKPFSSPHYKQSIRPLVTSEEAARVEVLRGLSPWGW